MDAEQSLSPEGISEPKPVNSIMSRVARLILAFLIALVVLAGLCSRLSVVGRQAQAGRTAVLGQSINGPARAVWSAEEDVRARCWQPALGPVKQVDPSRPDTGSVVTITIIITGLGPKPMDVILLQDVSGSMLTDEASHGQTRLAIAQAAAVTFVNQLGDEDRVAVVAYSETARLAAPLMADAQDIVEIINNRLTARPGWYTNIGDGILAGYGELISSSRCQSRTVKAMVLLSDGGANRPETASVAESHAREEAAKAGDQGFLIYTIGLGDADEVNEALLQTIADATGGAYYHSPNGAHLGTIYRDIAVGLRNLVVTDTLPSGINVDCSLLPQGLCGQVDGLTTTVVFSPGNEALLVNPLVLSFTATVNLDPGYEGAINGDGSQVCYDGPGGRACQDLEPPTVAVGGRKVTGLVFQDLDRDAHLDPGEGPLSGVVVTTSNGLTSRTGDDGLYMFRTSDHPTLTVAISVPTNYVAVGSAITRIRPVSGIYQWNFGLCPIVDGILVDQVRVAPCPECYGDTATLHYSVVNQDEQHRVLSGTIFIADSIGRTFDGGDFELPPDGRTGSRSSTFTVPHDVVITLTARATADVYGGLLVSDQATETLCPRDLYEPDDKPEERRMIYVNKPQLHDFHRANDRDWVHLELQQQDRSLYVFTARPLEPDGVPISLTLLMDGASLSGSNLDGPRSVVRISKVLSCAGRDRCGYPLLVQPASHIPAGGCWTDYELLVTKTPEDESGHVFLPVVMKQ